MGKSVISHFARGCGGLKSILQSFFGTLGHKVGSAVRVQLWKQQSLLKKSVSQACQLVVYQFLNKLLVNKDMGLAWVLSLTAASANFGRTFWEGHMPIPTNAHSL